MKPINFIKRNINIPTSFSNSICDFIIFKAKYSGLILIKLKYFYITFFIISIHTTFYSQESLLEYGGTTLICIVRHDTIWIGVDSKMELEGNNSESPPVCKIINAGHFIFAHAGFNQIISTNIDINNIFYNSVKKGRNNIHKTISIFNENIISAFRFIGPLMIKQRGYSVGDTIHGLTLYAFFATYENGLAKVFSFSYFTTVTNAKTPQIPIFTEITSDHLVGKMGQFQTQLAGESYEIKDIIMNYTTENIRILMNSLIKIEIKAHPERVGLPINIIRIAKDGIHWVQKNQPCK